MQGNDFVSPCGDSSFTYLDICDASLNATDEVTADSPAAAPGNAPDVTLPAESPAVASEEPASRWVCLPVMPPRYNSADLIVIFSIVIIVSIEVA